jgi:hypothetical protein
VVRVVNPQPWRQPIYVHMCSIVLRKFYKMLYYATRYGKKRPGGVLDGARQRYASFLMLDRSVLEKMCRQVCLMVFVYIACCSSVLYRLVPEKALYAVLGGIHPSQLLFASARRKASDPVGGLLRREAGLM